MLKWSLNWGEITPRILVGTCPMTTADLDRIDAEAGVSAVLSVQHDDCLAYLDSNYSPPSRRLARPTAMPSA
jgi:hypothetical protein